MNRGELQQEIKRVLKFPTDIANSQLEFEFNRTLSIVTDEQLEAILVVSRKAAGDDLRAYGRESECLFDRENGDAQWIVTLVTANELKDVYALAKAGNQIPVDITLFQAFNLMSTLRFGVFEMTPDRIIAYLEASTQLRRKYGKGLTLGLMVLVQNHPDKVSTIVHLAGKNSNVSEAQVLSHHGIELALMDGAL